MIFFFRGLGGDNESDTSSLSQPETTSSSSIKIDSHPAQGSQPQQSQQSSLNKRKSLNLFFSRRSPSNDYPQPKEASSGSFATHHQQQPPPAASNHSSSTRLATLPPKTAAEERKHQQMHNAMIKQAEEREKKRQEQELRKRERREQQLLKNAALWQNDFIPNWDERREHSARRMIEVAEEGVPSKFRGRVWDLSVGNDLNVTEELFSICLERAKAALNIQKAKHSRHSPSSSNSSVSSSAHGVAAVGAGGGGAGVVATDHAAGVNLRALGKEDTVELITTDLTRTFPSLGFFQVGGPFYEPLRNVLEAYVTYRPDIGYVQGMSFLAATLLLNADTFDAFKILCNMLNRRCHMAFFQMDLKRIQGYKEVFRTLFQELLPALFAHFEHCGVEPELFIFDWFITLYTRSLPLEIASRIWDVYFLQGEYFLFKTAIGILRTIEKRLLGQPFDVIAYDLTHLPAMDEAEFFENVHTLPLLEKRFAAVLAKHVPKV